MSGIQPQNLSNEELLRYVHFLEMKEIPQWAQAWLTELAKRLELFVDAAR
jgi:hypothetical protein